MLSASSTDTSSDSVTAASGSATGSASGSAATSALTSGSVSTSGSAAGSSVPPDLGPLTAARSGAAAQRARCGGRRSTPRSDARQGKALDAQRPPLTRRPGEPLGDWNGRTAALLDGINAAKRVYLSSTALPVEDGHAFTLRVCVLGFRIPADRIAACLEDLEAALPSG